MSIAVPAAARVVVVLALLALTAAGCGRDGGSSTRLSVVAGFYPLQFAAEQVGGDRVIVSSLAQPGAEPHDLELSPRQVAVVADADLVVYLAGFQPALDEAVAQEAGGTGFDAATTVALMEVDNHWDPHVWLDPSRLTQIATALAQRLAAVDPEGEQDYLGRARTFTDRLAELDRQFSQGLSTCQRREIVVSHAAFGYLTARYHLTQVAISGLTPHDEPTPQRLAEVAAVARNHSATVIFFESLASPKVAHAVATEVGARTMVLDPIEGLPPGQAGDYFSLMRANLANLRSALDCR